MIFLKQSTATDVVIGPFVDDTDGKTTEEALTLAQADLQLTKNGGTAAQKNDATSATHLYGGHYKVDLNATDTATLGHLRLMCKESGALPVMVDFMVVTANWYDTMCSTDQLDVNVTNVAGTAQTANDNGADINAILVDTGTTIPSTLTTIEGKVDTVDTNVDAILVDTAEIGVAGAGLTTIPWNASWDAEVQSEVTDGLNAYDPPTKTELDSAFTEIKGATWASGTDTLEHIRNKQTDIEADTSDIQTQIGTAGDGLTNINLPNQTMDITGSLSGSVGSVTTEVSANVTKISGDSTAADNLELMYDGTGYTDVTAPASRDQVGRIASGTAAISVSASAFVKSGAEVETLTYISTVAEDGIYHQVAPASGTTDIYYEFDVGANGVPVSVTWIGYANAKGDTYTVWAYNYGITSYEQIGTISGKSGSTPRSEIYDLTSSHVGTGANAGKVRFRIYSTGATTGTNFATDRLLCSYAVVNQSVGYSLGSIWVDTNASNTNTVNYIDGVADNPVSTWAAALTLSSQMGLNSFRIVNGSSITLTSDSSELALQGESWNLDMNGQDISGIYVYGARLTGVGVNGGAIPTFEACNLGTVSIPASNIRGCGIAGDVTINEAGTFYFDACFSGVAGTSTPVLDFGSTIGDTNVNFRHYSGGISLANMGQSGNDTMSLEGHGQYVLQSNCIGGTIAVRGHFKKTDNTTGAVTISDDTNFKNTVITFGYAQGAGVNGNQIQLASSASSVDGAYDPAMIVIVSGTGAGQTRLILQYDGATKVATVDRNWKVDPDITSEYRISGHPGREHVNEGLAQAGSTSSTIVLNALANSTDDAYKGQICFIRSGTGDDQVALIDSYVGSTKVATLASGQEWAVTPDTTSAYVMLPNNIHSLSSINAEIDTAISDYDGPTNTEMAAAFTEIKGATWNSATDTLEAIRDRGDSAWVTAGTSISNIINIQPLIPNNIDLADTAIFRFGLILINSLDDLPSTAEITPGTISIDRKMIGGTSWNAVVTDAACSEIAGLIYYDEVFDSGSGYAEGDSIRITLKNQKVTVDANDYEIIGNTGRIFYSNIKQTMRGTDSAATASALSTHDSKLDTVDANVDSILTDTNEIQGDLTDGGRIDLLIDAIKAKTDNQPAGVQKNVALSNFMFQMVDETDGKTPELGLTPTCTISKDGGAFAACTNSPTEVSDGLYKIDITQDEMNADVIVLSFSDATSRRSLININTSS